MKQPFEPVSADASVRVAVPAAPRPRQTKFAHAAAPLVICLVAFALLNLALCSIVNGTQSAMWGAILFGLLFGQLGWLATWVVMGPSRWPIRLLLALAAAAALYSLFVVGIVSADAHQSLREMFQLLPILPLVVLSTAFPLLLLRGSMGWQIAYLGRAPAAARAATRRFAIRDLFAVTAAVAVSLALAQLGLKWASADADTSRQVVVGYSLGFAGLSLFLACPCVWSSLRIRSMVLGSIMVIGYAAALGTLSGWGCIWLVQLWAPGGGSPHPFEVIWPFILFNSAVVLTLHSSLVLARKCGYGLLRSPRRRSSVGLAEPQGETANPG